MDENDAEEIEIIEDYDDPNRNLLDEGEGMGDLTRVKRNKRDRVRASRKKV